MTDQATAKVVEEYDDPDNTTTVEVPAGSLPLHDSRRETYAQARAEGLSRRQAAIRVRRTAATGSHWERTEPDLVARIAWLIRQRARPREAVNVPAATIEAELLQAARVAVESGAYKAAIDGYKFLHGMAIEREKQNLIQAEGTALTEGELALLQSDLGVTGDP